MVYIPTEISRLINAVKFILSPSNHQRDRGEGIGREKNLILQIHILESNGEEMWGGLFYGICLLTLSCIV
jgi:hypothetical protein